MPSANKIKKGKTQINAIISQSNKKWLRKEASKADISISLFLDKLIAKVKASDTDEDSLKPKFI